MMNFEPQGWQLETERLLLLPPQDEEGAWLYPAVQESLPQLQLWMPWAKKKTSIQALEEFTARSVAEFGGKTNLETRLWTREGTFLGCVGLHPRDWGVPSFEVGYWCRTSAAGQGYTSEAVRALTHFALEQLGAQRLQIRCDPRNVASRRVAEKCGYALEAVHHREARDNSGELCDICFLTRFPAS